VRSRGRKMMMFRMMMLRRRTDPKTGTHTLYEPAQSKCNCTCHNSHVMPGGPTLCEPAQAKCTWTCHKTHALREFRGKMPATSWSILIKHRPLHLP
jgi:hypothetical protein